LNDSSKVADACEEYNSINKVQKLVHLLESFHGFGAVGRFYCFFSIDEYMKLVDEVMPKYLMHDSD